MAAEGMKQQIDMTTTDCWTYYMNKPLIRFIVNPKTITRMVCWIFSVIVCGSIMTGGFQNLPTSSELKCVLNENPAACGYGIGFGIVAAQLCQLFLLLDFFEPHIKTYILHKMICIADFACSVLCTAIWFIGFCFLAHQWSLSTPDAYPLGVESCQTAIVFSFLSIPCWLVLSYFAFMQFNFTPDECKHSSEEAILPAMRKLSSLSSDMVDPLQSSSSVAPTASTQEIDNTFQN